MRRSPRFAPRSISTRSFRIVYVVTVEFVVREERVGEFRVEIMANARASRAERGCRQFDVCVAPEDPSRLFLYEVYVDRAAFDEHLQTAHFAAFDAATAAWTLRKSVHAFDRIDP